MVDSRLHIDAGVDLPTLKELLHESISTTMQYVYPTPEHKLRAVLRLETYNAEERKLAAKHTLLVYDTRRASMRQKHGFATRLETISASLLLGISTVFGSWLKLP